MDPVHPFRPLLPLAAALVAGMLLVHLWRWLQWPAVAGCAMCATVLGVGAARRWVAVWLPPALYLCLGGCLLLPWQVTRLPAAHIARWADSQSCTLTGTVRGRVRQLPWGHRAVLQVDHLRCGASGFRPAVGRIRLNLRGPLPPDVARGVRLEVSGRLRPIRSFANPGGFDYRAYMRRQRIWASLSAGASRVRVLAPASRRPSPVETLRRATAARLAAAVAHPAAEAVLRALVLGERDAVAGDLRDAFNRAGVGHLLAISGLHVGSVAAGVFALLRWGCGFSARLRSRAWTRKTVALATLGPVWFYAALAGLSPSTQRAGVMVTVFLLAVVIERDHDPLNTLAVAALALLIAYPPALLTVSFQLSFSAVAAILIGWRCWAPAFDPPARNLGQWLRPRIQVLLLATALATLGTLPLVARTFHQVSLVGLAMNLVCVPLVSAVVLPLGLLALPATVLGGPLAGWLLQLAAGGLIPMIAVVTRVADQPWAALFVAPPGRPAVLAYYLLGGGGLCLLARWRQGELPVWPGARPYALRWLAALLVVVVAGGAVLVRWQRGHGSGVLRVTVVDVGQGSAALVELPDGGTLLLDGGGFSDNSVFDMGERVVAPLLWHRGVRRVDIMALSHADSDHLNGLTFIAAQFPVGQIWFNGQGRRTQGYARFRETVARRAIPLPAYAELPRRLVRGGAEVRLLAPPVDFAARTAREPWRDGNNNSLVLQIRYGRVVILLPGDIRAAAEQDLCRRYGAELASTVLVVPHHGSRHSSSAAFLDAVRPRVAVISAGGRHRSHLPHPAVVTRLHRRGCAVWCTAAHGAVTLKTDGRRLSVSAYVPPDGLLPGMVTAPAVP